MFYKLICNSIALAFSIRMIIANYYAFKRRKFFPHSFKKFVFLQSKGRNQRNDELALE